jgi:hypothetical protein
VAKLSISQDTKRLASSKQPDALGGCPDAEGNAPHPAAQALLDEELVHAAIGVGEGHHTKGKSQTGDQDRPKLPIPEMGAEEDAALARLHHARHLLSAFHLNKFCEAKVMGTQELQEVSGEMTKHLADQWGVVADGAVERSC